MKIRVLIPALLPALLGAQAIPPRPEALAFAPVQFRTPSAREHQARLKNGIPVFLAPNGKDGAPLVRITVNWKGGGYLEPAGKEGLATLFGSQLVLGGTASLDPAALQDRLEALAATLTSSCAPTAGSISLTVQEKDLQAGLDLLVQCLTAPAFAQDRLDLARRQARQGLSRRNDMVGSIAGYLQPALLSGPDHFSAKQPTAASLDAVTREDLLAFHRRLLHPANLVVAASGAFDRKAMLERLDRALGALKPAPGAQASPVPPAPAFQRKPGLYLAAKDAPQAMLTWTLPGLRRTDPDWHKAYVMNQLLGGPGFTSRLMKKIRSDEGLTYGVYSNMGPGPHYRGDITGSMQTKNRSVAYALRLALAEMARLKEAPPTAAELQVIKEGLLESFPAQWSSKHATVSRFAEEALVGWNGDWWQDFREKVQAVTPADVQAMARKYLELDKLVILAVGRKAEMEAGDPDHPGALKDAAGLPVTELPLRDPLTLKALDK